MTKQRVSTSGRVSVWALLAWAASVWGISLPLAAQQSEPDLAALVESIDAADPALVGNVDEEVERLEQEAEESFEKDRVAKPAPVDASLFVGEDHPFLFEDLEVDGYERLEAAISVEDKGATVSFAPWLLVPNYTAWSETRFQIAHKDGVSSLGVALKYNPVSPYSERGRELWRQHHAEWLEKVAPLEEDADLARRVWKRAVEEDQRLDAEAVPEIASMRQAVQDLDDELAKTEKAEQHPQLRQQRSGRLKELASLVRVAKTRRLEAVLAAPEAERREGFDLGQAEIEAARRRHQGAITAADKAFAAVVRRYNEELLEARKPILSLAYTVGFFSVIDSSEDDADGDGLEDNKHAIARRALAATATWRHGRSQLSALLGRTWERASAEEGSALGEYNAGGLTWGYRLAVLNPKYKTTKAYLESLFVPTVVGGLAIEHRDCLSNDEDCADGILREMALTAFVDFKISPTAQFRIGIPARERRALGGKDKTDVGVTTLVSFQIGKVP